MLRAVSQKPVSSVSWYIPAAGVLLLSAFLAWRITVK